MKDIVLHLEEDVFDDLKSEVSKKRLVGTFGGVIDMAALAIVETIKANRPERTLRYKKNKPVINAWGA